MGGWVGGWVGGCGWVGVGVIGVFFKQCKQILKQLHVQYSCVYPTVGDTANM